MKILLISPSPPPYGGIASWTINLLDYYSRDVNNYEIIHQNSSVKSRNITDSKLITRIISGIKETSYIYSAFKDNLFSKKPDIVHLTSSGSLALFKDIKLLRFAEKRNTPVIIHFHFGRIPELFKADNWEWHLLCKVIKKSQIIIVIDEKSQTTLLESGFKNIVNIPNPVSVEIEKIALQLKLHPVGKKKGKVIFIGHVIPNKGIFELVKACTSIPEINELIIVGPFEKTIKNDLMTLANKRDNASWIKFTGNLEKGDVLEQLMNSNLLVLPSYTEGFPNVIIEAMAMGCPVIASEVGAIPAMLNINSDKPCGICIKPKKIDELSLALTALLSDFEKANELGENGIDRILSHYTFSIISKEYEKIWDNVILKSRENFKNKMQDN